MVALVLFWLLYGEIKSQLSNLDLSLIFKTLSTSVGSLVFVVVLMILNWLTEAVKWYSEVKRVQSLSPKVLLNSILVGISASAITPFRVGDLAARLSFIESQNRKVVLYINAFMATSQLLVTLIFGFLAISNLPSLGKIFKSELIVAPFFFSLLIPLFVYTYFKSNLLLKLFNSKSIHINVDFIIATRNRLFILTLSTLRYFIFCCQFFIIARIFEPSIGFLVSSQTLALIFLVKTVIPSSFLSEIAVRISVGYFIFELMGFTGFNGVISTFILWVINLFTPAILGVFTLTKVQWLKVKNVD